MKGHTIGMDKELRLQTGTPKRRRFLASSKILYFQAIWN